VAPTSDTLPAMPIVLHHVHPEVAPHPRPPALDLARVLDDAVLVADEVRLGLDRRHDERDVGLGGHVAELLLDLSSTTSDCRRAVPHGQAALLCAIIIAEIA
jgi:hypothetical protein